MSNANYKIVLSDKLYSIYKKAGTKNTLNSKERRSYELLIGNIELDILTNAAQLERCKLKHNLPDEIYNDLYPALINSDDKDLTLIELAKKTLFKLIITQNNEDISPPYFNLNDNNVIRNYIITRLHNEDRGYLEEYLKGLFENACKILIHDKYFSSEDDNKKLFDLLPDKKLVIYYVENASGNNGRFIKNKCEHNTKWQVNKCDMTTEEFNRFSRSHDRYLIIDDEIEITLTSGFSYIWCNNKEITSVFRKYQRK